MRKSTFIIATILMIGCAGPPSYGGIPNDITFCSVSSGSRSYTGPFATFGISMFDRGPSEEKSARASKSTALKKAEQAFIKGDYEEVIIIGNSYSTHRAKSDDELQHLLGRALLKLKRFNEARNRFWKVANHSDNDRLLSEAYIGLADSYYLEGNFKKAKGHYDEVMRYFPDSDDMPIVYYRLAECYSKLDKDSTSKEYFDKVIRIYPDSLEAKLLMGEKSDFVTYSVQVGSFKRRENAKKLCDELKGKEFDANIYTATLGDSPFYRVRVGKFNRLGDAEDMARTLRNRGYSTKIYP